MLTAVFSDYSTHPGMSKSTNYPCWGIPSIYIEGDRPRKLVLVGEFDVDVKDGAEMCKVNHWFWHMGVDRMDIGEREVIIDVDLPEQLTQWVRAAEYYKGKNK